MGFLLQFVYFTKIRRKNSNKIGKIRNKNLVVPPSLILPWTKIAACICVDKIDEKGDH